MSGKGGVGKSTTETLLSAGLRCSGWQVGLLAADVTGASLPKLFGVRQPPLADGQGVLLLAMTPGGIKLVSVNLMLKHEDDAVGLNPALTRAGAAEQAECLPSSLAKRCWSVPAKSPSNYRG